MQEVSAVGPPDDDMLDGDLGDGMGSRPPSSSLRSKFQSSSLVSDGQPPRRSCPSGEAAWKPKLKLAGWKQGACWKLPGPVAEVSKSELSARLQEAGQIIELLFCELEVAQRYLEGKYEALRILQGKAILDKATCHTKSLLQKSEEKAKALEKEVNCLQWEVSFGQVQLRKSEQSWEQRHNRVVNENRSLSDTLEKRESEIQHLRAENSALSQQLLELLALLKVKEQRTYLATRPQYTPEKDATVLELAVLGACRCISVDESCPCSRTAAATRKQLLQLQQELDFQHSRREEALMVADAFRIAFEQQLRKRSDRLMLLAESNVHKLSHCKAEGVSRRPLVSVSQRLRALLPPNLELSVPDHLLEALYRLIDLLNDKEEALAHQRKVSIMLAHSAEELQKQLDLDCSPAQPAPDCQGAGGPCHLEGPSGQDKGRLHMVSTASQGQSQGQKADQNHRPAPSDAPPVSCDPARDQNHGPAPSDAPAPPVSCDPARDQNHGPAPSDAPAPPVSCDPAIDQNHSPAASDSPAPPVSCDPAQDQNHGSAPSDAATPPLSCDPARDQNHRPAPSHAPAPPVSCDPTQDQNHGSAPSDAPPASCDPARDQNHGPAPSDAPPVSCDPARDQNHGSAPSDAPPASCDPAQDQNHGPAPSDAPPVSCDPARDQCQDLVTLPPPETTQVENPSLPNSEPPAADLCEDQICSPSQSSNCLGAADPVPVQTESPSYTVVTTVSCDDTQDPHEDRSQSVSGAPQPTEEQQQN
ncbi:coiled-coil domain-containing protein 125 isoform 2-T2 [Synchiropus picturatus]